MTNNRTSVPLEPDASNPADRIIRPAIVLAGLSLVGLALTLGWQLTIAAIFGTSAELDAFWIGAAIPKAISDSFHLGVLTLLFVVVFNLPQGEQTEADRDRLSSSLFNVVFCGTLALALLLLVAAPQLTRMMGPGLDAGQIEISTRVLRTLTFMMAPTAVAGAMAGILHAHQRFTPFALSRSVGLAIQIMVVALVARHSGTQVLAWAMLAGSTCIIFACLPSFRRTGFRYHATIDFRGDEARSVLRMLGALVGLGVLSRLNQISDRYFASLLGDGAVSALEFGWRFEIPVSQILSFSIALPAFAMMALQASSGRLDDFRNTVGTSVRLSAILISPVIIFLIVMREPLVILWFQRGAFSPEAVRQVVALLPILGVMFAILAFGPILVFGLLSLHQKRILMGILALEVSANTLLNGPLSRQMGVQGVALATVVAMTVSNAALWSVLIRRMGGVDLTVVFHRALRTAIACLAAAAILLGMRGAFWSALTLQGPFVALSTLAIVGVGYLAIFASICHAVGLLRIYMSDGRPRLSLGTES